MQDTKIRVFPTKREVRSFDTHCAHNRGVSYPALGVHSYIIARYRRDPNHVVRVSDLRNRQKAGKKAIEKGDKVGRDSMQGYLKELVAHGYAHLETSRDKKGQVSSSYVFFENPADKSLYLGNPEPENPEPETGLPEPENPVPYIYTTESSSISDQKEEDGGQSQPGTPHTKIVVPPILGPQGQVAEVRVLEMQEILGFRKKVGKSEHWIPTLFRERAAKMLDEFPRLCKMIEHKQTAKWKELEGKLQSIWIGRPGRDEHHEINLLIFLMGHAEKNEDKNYRSFFSCMLDTDSKVMASVTNIPRYRRFMTTEQVQSEEFCKIWEDWLVCRTTNSVRSNHVWAKNFLETAGTCPVEQQVKQLTWAVTNNVARFGAERICNPFKNKNNEQNRDWHPYDRNGGKDVVAPTDDSAKWGVE